MSIIERDLGMKKHEAVFEIEEKFNEEVVKEIINNIIDSNNIDKISDIVIKIVLFNGNIEVFKMRNLLNILDT